MPAPYDLRAAALSDLRHASTAALALLLPDVPGEPYGGIATPAQRQAVAEVRGRSVSAQTSYGQPVRPAHLRVLMRAWAASHSGSDNAAGLRGAVARLSTLDDQGRPLSATPGTSLRPDSPPRS